jgi:hypothetical protein
MVSAKILVVCQAENGDDAMNKAADAVAQNNLEQYKVEVSSVDALTILRTEEPNTLACECCGSLEAFETECPYALEVAGLEVYAVLCNNCFEQRQQDC